MKRALAARAKHDPNGLAPAAVVSSPQPKPSKIPRVEPKQEELPSNSSSSNGVGGSGAESGPGSGAMMNSQQPQTLKPKEEPLLTKSNNVVVPSSVPETKSTSTKVKQNSLPNSPRPNKPGRPSMKRQRASQTPAAEEDDETGAFFLKHQNAALSSELQQLRFQFSLLEKERDFRRTQCKDANQALHSLEATWTAMEVALQLGKQPPRTDEDLTVSFIRSNCPVRFSAWPVSLACMLCFKLLTP